MLKNAKQGATFLLNAPFGKDRGLEPAAEDGPAADHRQEAEVLRHRRRASRREARPRAAHQRHHADRLLQDLRHHPPRAGGQRDQERHRQVLRQGRREGRQHEQAGRRHRPREHRGSRRAGQGRQRHRDAVWQVGRLQRNRPDHPRPDHRRPRPQAAALGDACRRHLPDRHRQRSKNATSPSTSRSGKRTSASSAASAPSSAPMPPSA